MKIEFPFLKSKHRGLSSKTIALLAKKGDDVNDVATQHKVEAKTLKEKKDEFLSSVSFLGTNLSVSIMAIAYILFVEGCIFINGYIHNYLYIVKTTAGINVFLSGAVLFAMLPMVIEGRKFKLKDSSLSFIVTIAGLGLVFLLSLLSLLGMFDGGSAPTP